jgi:hypothetical protein
MAIPYGSKTQALGSTIGSYFEEKKNKKGNKNKKN